jgi:hypothetical protein
MPVRIEDAEEGVYTFPPRTTREVIAAGFCKRRNSVGRYPVPAGNTDVNAFFETIGAKIGTPFPCSDRDIDRVLRCRAKANVPQTAKRDWPDVSTVHQLVCSNDVLADTDQGLQIVGNIYAMNNSGVK